MYYKIGTLQIGPASICDREYCDELKTVSSLTELKAVIDKWRPLVSDAAEIVDRMDEDGFARYQKSAAKERRGKFSNDMDCGVILMPSVVLHVGLIASRFGAPFGCAFGRMEEFGHIKIEDNRVIVVSMDEKPKK